MVAAIRQHVTVQAGGVVQVSSPELTPGASAEVIILITAQPDGRPPYPAAALSEPSAPRAGNWRRHAGALRGGGDPRASNNERIDRDLASEYGSGGDLSDSRAGPA